MTTPEEKAVRDLKCLKGLATGDGRIRDQAGLKEALTRAYGSSGNTVATAVTISDHLGVGIDGLGKNAKLQLGQYTASEHITLRDSTVKRLRQVAADAVSDFEEGKRKRGESPGVNKRKKGDEPTKKRTPRVEKNLAREMDAAKSPRLTKANLGIDDLTSLRLAVNSDNYTPLTASMRRSSHRRHLSSARKSPVEKALEEEIKDLKNKLQTKKKRNNRADDTDSDDSEEGNHKSRANNRLSL